LSYLFSFDLKFLFSSWFYWFIYWFIYWFFIAFIDFNFICPLILVIYWFLWFLLRVWQDFFWKSFCFLSGLHFFLFRLASGILIITSSMALVLHKVHLRLVLLSLDFVLIYLFSFRFDVWVFIWERGFFVIFYFHWISIISFL
jgi:hypothetical protein